MLRGMNITPLATFFEDIAAGFRSIVASSDCTGQNSSAQTSRRNLAPQQIAPNQCSTNSEQAENRRIMHAPQVQIKSLTGSGLPFDADDIRDAVTIAAASKKPDIAKTEFIAGVPRRSAQSRYIPVSNQAHLERYTSEDGHRKVNAFLAQLGQTQTFFFKDGMVRTASGLEAMVTYNEQLKKLCIYFVGTDLEDPYRGPQTLCADIGIVSGDIKPMFSEAVKLSNCATSVFGPDNVMLCGHSLGGSICQFVSASIGIPGIAMNSAPVNENWLLNLPSEKLKWVQKNSCQVSVENDILGLASTFASCIGCVHLFKETITVPYNGNKNPHYVDTLKEAVDAFSFFKRKV
jgi:hypothetical protein